MVVPRPSASAAAIVMCLLAGCSFEGMRGTSDSGQINVQVAVGSGQIVELASGRMRIFTTGPLGEVLSDQSVADFLGCGQANTARVRFDRSESKWYMAAAERTPVPRICFAVSSASSALSSWYRYTFNTEAGTYPNFSNLGFSTDKVGITYQRLQEVSGQGPPAGIFLIVFPKTNLPWGGPLAVTTFLFDGLLLAPGTTLTPSGGDQQADPTLYLAGMGGNNLRLWRVVGGNPAVLLSAINVPIVYNEVTPDAPQLNSIDLLRTPGGVRDVVVRNSTIYVSGTSACIPAGDTALRTCLRLVEFTRLPGEVYSPGNDIEFGIPGQYVFFPALALDADRALVVGFGASGPTMYPQLMVTGRRTTDQLNTLKTPTVIHPGQAAYTNGDAVVDVLEWGRYYGAATAGADERTSFVAGAYAPFAVYPTASPPPPPRPAQYATRVQKILDALF